MFNVLLYSYKTKKMNILIAGGSGFIGHNLSRELQSSGHNIIVLTRNKEKVSQQAESYGIIDYEDLLNGNIPCEISGVINLSGSSIASGRWTKGKKEEILQSRIDSTMAVISAIEKSIIRPKVFINSSAVGYYGDCGNKILTESDGSGNDFLSKVCVEWESVASKAILSGVRTVYMRTGLVLGNGGVLNKLILPYKFYMGGIPGSGKQWVSWIHIKDISGIIEFILKKEEIHGPVNFTAPEPLQMKDLQKAIGKVLQSPSWLKLPTPFLKVALGEMSSIMLNSQRVLPDTLIRNNYQFIYPSVDDALQDIFSKNNQR